MKGYIFLGLLIASILVAAIDPSLVADQVLNWAKQNTKNQSTPEVLFDTGRVCQFLTDGDTAIEVYNTLYQLYPDQAVFCAPAMYYCGKIKAESSYVKIIRVQAVPFLQIVLDQYSDQQEWFLKAQQLMNEVNGDRP